MHKYFQRSIVDEWLWITFLFLHTRNRFLFFPVIILLFFIHICAGCTKKIHFSSYLSALYNVLYLFFDIFKAISPANISDSSFIFPVLKPCFKLSFFSSILGPFRAFYTTPFFYPFFLYPRYPLYPHCSKVYRHLSG